jgi:hypothetical protein
MGRPKGKVLPYITFGGRDCRIVLNPSAVKLMEVNVDDRLKVKTSGGKLFINVKSLLGLSMKDCGKNGFICYHKAIVRQAFVIGKNTLPEEKRGELFAVKFEILPDDTEGWYQLSEIPLKMYK